ncbi:MAG: thymidylate synthase [Bacteroidota bacterium]|nr:thymidylate synthase [Bacteroidota bacterium]
MEPLVIKGANLSGSWCEILDYLSNNPGNEISPLVLTITDFEESSNIRELLDEDLRKHNLPSIQTVSETIFPQSLYQFCDFDRVVLYKQYLQNYRFIRGAPGNNKGTYFQRLTAFENGADPINQLEMIITSLQGSTVKRRSKLQASIFDPTKDHTTGMFQKFPCLQHVTFYKSEKGGLVLNSFYAMQYFYRRAYGNWLGLVNLGKFVARESGLEFERLNCFVGVEHLDNITKAEAKKLTEKIGALLA